MHPARSLDDLELNEGAIRPDFEVGDRYLTLSKELTRLALLGITGYGFLIKELLFKVESDVTPLHLFLMGTGILALGLSAASSLITSQLSTNCLNLQVDILRYIKRKTNGGWTDKERTDNDRILEKKRASQRHVIESGKQCLTFAVGSLIAELILTVVTFGLILKQGKVYKPGGASKTLSTCCLAPCEPHG